MSSVDREERAPPAEKLVREQREGSTPGKGRPRSRDDGWEEVGKEKGERIRWGKEGDKWVPCL
jgi:hypothetical protein